MCNAVFPEVCKMQGGFNGYFHLIRVHFDNVWRAFGEFLGSWSDVFVAGVFPCCSGKQQRGAVGWVVVWHQGQHAVCSADAALCSWEIPRWCRLSGVSQEAITFQSENKLTRLWQPESLIAKSLFCKGLCSWRLVLFMWNLLRSWRTPNYILKKNLGGIWFLLFYWYCGKTGDQSLPFNAGQKL